MKVQLLLEEQYVRQAAQEMEKRYPNFCAKNRPHVEHAIVAARKSFVWQTDADNGYRFEVKNWFGGDLINHVDARRNKCECGHWQMRKFCQHTLTVHIALHAWKIKTQTCVNTSASIQSA